MEFISLYNKQGPRKKKRRKKKENKHKEEGRIERGGGGESPCMCMLAHIPDIGKVWRHFQPPDWT